MLKLTTIVGARPQFVKAAVVSRAIHDHNRADPDLPVRETILHTGQHFDVNMSDRFFEDLAIPRPTHNLGIQGCAHGAMTGRMLEKVEQVLQRDRPDWVLVYGDTNSTLAGALAAVKLHIPVAHVEAGLRSFNRRMPEELNRVLTDRVSTLLFCPTERSVENLNREGIASAGQVRIEPGLHHPRAYLVGDVMYDSYLRNVRNADTSIFRKLGLQDAPDIRPFYLATVHRPENTDNPDKLHAIFTALRQLSRKAPVILPLHPRTRAKLKALPETYAGLTLIEPVSYPAMIGLQKEARVILTDSGGLQKEAYFARTPCITLRAETEWVELIEAGVNVLTGADTARILEAEAGFHKRNLGFETRLYGNGKAGKTIVSIFTHFLESFEKLCQHANT